MRPLWGQRTDIQRSTVHTANFMPGIYIPYCTSDFSPRFGCNVCEISLLSCPYPWDVPHLRLLSSEEMFDWYDCIAEAERGDPGLHVGLT